MDLLHFLDKEVARPVGFDVCSRDSDSRALGYNEMLQN